MWQYSAAAVNPANDQGNITSLLQQVPSEAMRSPYVLNAKVVLALCRGRWMGAGMHLSRQHFSTEGLPWAIADPITTYPALEARCMLNRCILRRERQMRARAPRSRHLQKQLSS